jgi:hypothetical protein
MIFLKLWIFTNLNTVFPVIVLVFEEFSEEVLHGYWDEDVVFCIIFYLLNERMNIEINDINVNK